MRFFFFNAGIHLADCVLGSHFVRPVLLIIVVVAGENNGRFIFSCACAPSTMDVWCIRAKRRVAYDTRLNVYGVWAPGIGSTAYSPSRMRMVYGLLCTAYGVWCTAPGVWRMVAHSV